MSENNRKFNMILWGIVFLVCIFVFIVVPYMIKPIGEKYKEITCDEAFKIDYEELDSVYEYGCDFNPSNNYCLCTTNIEPTCVEWAEKKYTKECVRYDLNYDDERFLQNSLMRGFYLK